MARDSIVLDSGAFSALAHEEETIRHVVRRAVEAGASVVVPAVVLAESLTGTARDAAANHVVKATLVVPASESIARRAAGLRFMAKRPIADTIDAIVVATAEDQRASLILTSDEADLRRLAPTPIVVQRV